VKKFGNGLPPSLEPPSSAGSSVATSGPGVITVGVYVESSAVGAGASVETSSLSSSVKSSTTSSLTIMSSKPVPSQHPQLKKLIKKFHTNISVISPMN